MKRLIAMLLAVVVFVGCSSNKMNTKEIREAIPSKLSKVEAFQDEYTRQFMYSTKEVEQGYYLFSTLQKKY